MDLRGTALDAEGDVPLRAYIQGLQANDPELEGLELEQVDESELVDLRDAIEASTALRKLSLFSTAEPGASVLLASLGNNRGIRSLQVELSGAAGDAMAALGQALGRNSTLCTIDLWNCPVTDQGAAPLASALSSNELSGVRHLRLRNCGLSGDSCPAIASLLEANSTLQELDLAENPLGSRVDVVLRSMLCNCGLRALTISRCDCDGGWGMMGYLDRGGLDLDDGEGGDGGDVATGEGGESLERRLANFQEQLSISVDGANQPAHGGPLLGRNSTLIQLDYSQNCLIGSRFNMIAAIAERCAVLRELGFYDCRVGPVEDWLLPQLAERCARLMDINVGSSSGSLESAVECRAVVVAHWRAWQRRTTLVQWRWLINEHRRRCRRQRRG